jgi:NADH dehydrogenase/NADH:ubiquinone oxidoreductase subunit G
MPILLINNQPVEAPEGATVLEAARLLGVDIPTLCHHPALEPYAACRLCLVEVTANGREQVVTACAYPAREGLEVRTDTERIQRLRRGLLRLYLASAPASAVVRELAARYGVTEGGLVIPDPESNCIMCGLCQRVCEDLVGKGGLGFARRGRERKIGAPYEEALEDCLGCGACAFVCPTGAVTARLVGDAVEVEPWRARVPVALCEVCGQPVGPRAGLEELARKLEIGEERLLVCPVCRRRAHGRELVRAGQRANLRKL